MAQTCLYWRGPKTDAETLYGGLEVAFEEDPVALAIAEVDEARALFEVSLYAEGEVDAAFIERFAGAVGLQAEAVCRETLPDQDWMAGVLAELKPVRAGRFLVHGAHDRDKVAANDLAIEIEAGQAFGTGHHGTTAGCLEMITALAKRRTIANALDLGAGSAVLAIGLAKRLPIPVLATDIDPVAVEVARANIAANGVGNRVMAAVATGFDAPAIRRSGPYDLVVANILASPLMAMARRFPAHLARGGEVVLSGILVSQRRQVLAAFRSAGLVHRETITRSGWVTLRLSR